MKLPKCELSIEIATKCCPAKSLCQPHVFHSKVSSSGFGSLPFLHQLLLFANPGILFLFRIQVLKQLADKCRGIQFFLLHFSSALTIMSEKSWSLPPKSSAKRRSNCGLESDFGFGLTSPEHSAIFTSSTKVSWFENLRVFLGKLSGSPLACKQIPSSDHVVKVGNARQLLWQYRNSQAQPFCESWNLLLLDSSSINCQVRTAHL